MSFRAAFDGWLEDHLRRSLVNFHLIPVAPLGGDYSLLLPLAVRYRRRGWAVALHESGLLILAGSRQDA